MSQYAKLTVVALREACKAAGIDQTGKKAELIERSDNMANHTGEERRERRRATKGHRRGVLSKKKAI